MDELTSALQTRSYSAEALHGDMKQSERDRVMTKFRKGTIEILVATDVAARGIDVSDIEAVFNYDLPSDEEYYVHRIGRTGRAGKAGVSYSFIFGRDIYKLKDIMLYTKSEIMPMKPPTISDVEEVKLEGAVNEVLGLLEDPDRYKKYLPIIEKILAESADAAALDVAAALFSSSFADLDSRSYEHTDLDEDPHPLQKRRHGQPVLQCRRYGQYPTEEHRPGNRLKVFPAGQAHRGDRYPQKFHLCGDSGGICRRGHGFHAKLHPPREKGPHRKDSQAPGAAEAQAVRPQKIKK